MCFSRKNQILLIILSTVLLLISSSLFADEIILKSGKSYNGVIINQSRTMIEFRDGNGNHKIEKIKIRRIIYNRVPNESETDASNRKMNIEVSDPSSINIKQTPQNSPAESIKAGNPQKYQMLLSFEESTWRGMHQDLRRGDSDTAEVDSPDLPSSILATPSHTSNWSALLKSAILPGWGQYSQGRNVAAASYGTGALLAVILTGKTTAAAASASANFSNSSNLSTLSILFVGNGIGQFAVDPTAVPGVPLGLSAVDMYLISQRSSAYSASRTSQSNFYVMAGLATTLYIVNLVDVVLYDTDDSHLTANMGLSRNGDAAISLTFNF